MFIWISQSLNSKHSDRSRGQRIWEAEKRNSYQQEDSGSEREKKIRL
jgi:hypothetical protein